MKNIDSTAIRHLADLLKETDLSEIEVEQDGFRVRVARSMGQTVLSAPAAAPIQDNAATAAPPAAGIPAGAIMSPMVGNIYMASRPGADPFISVGSRVTEGQTLFIVEAMKVMNPIPSPRSGTVKTILVQDGQPVEYDDILAVIE